MRLRRDIMKALLSFLGGSKEMVRVSVPSDFSPFNKELVELMNFFMSGSTVSEDAFVPINNRLTNLKDIIAETKFVLPREIGSCLNGWIQAVVVVMESQSIKFTKKSDERKIFKSCLRQIGEKLTAINKVLETLKTNVAIPHVSAEFSSKDFTKKFAADFRAEIDLIKSGFKAVIDRINLAKV